MQCTYTAAYSCTALNINSSRDQILWNATNFLTIKGGSIKRVEVFLLEEIFINQGEGE